MSQLKKNMKHGVLVGALSLTLLTGVAAAKGPFGGQFGGDSGSRIDRMVERLELSDEQAVEFEKLMESRADQRSLKFQGMSEIQEMIDQGNVDLAAEQAANSARAGVYEMAENKRLLSEILTPEQLAKMEEIKERMKNRSKRSKQNKEPEVEG